MDRDGRGRDAPSTELKASESRDRSVQVLDELPCDRVTQYWLCGRMLNNPVLLTLEGSTMKVSFCAIVIALLCAVTANADDHKDWMKYFAGAWRAEDIASEAEFTPAADGNRRAV